MRINAAAVLFFFLFVPALARGQSFPDNSIPFLILPLDKPLFRPFVIPPLQKKRPVLREYMERPQFLYQMTPEIYREYEKIFADRLLDNRLLRSWNIERGKGKGLEQEEKEAVAYYSAARCFDEWTDFHIGTPRIRLGSNFLNTLENIFIKQIPLISFPFTTPFRKVREAEQGFRFYLRKFPGGAYTVPALLSIARCRIYEKDYMEAQIAYEFALRFIMEQKGCFRPDLEKEYGGKILDYARKYPDDLTISFSLAVTNCDGCFRSSFCFNPTNKSMNIYLTVSRSTD